MKTLRLPIKKKYFEQIRDGTKTEEYREYKPFWKKRLLNKEFDQVHITLGYPKVGDLSRVLVFPWNGFQVKEILHPEFGPGKIKVFAIKLEKEVVS